MDYDNMLRRCRELILNSGADILGIVASQLGAMEWDIKAYLEAEAIDEEALEEDVANAYIATTILTMCFQLDYERMREYTDRKLKPYQRSEDERAIEKIEDMLSGMSEEEKNEELKLMSRRIWMAVLLLRAYGQTGWIDKSAMEKICGDLYDGLLGIACRFELDKDRINYHIYSEFSIAKTIADRAEYEPCDE